MGSLIDCRVSQMANRARERADISMKYDVRFNEDGTVEHDLPDGISLPTRKKRYYYYYHRQLYYQVIRKVNALLALSGKHIKLQKGHGFISDLCIFHHSHNIFPLFCQIKSGAMAGLSDDNQYQ